MIHDREQLEQLLSERAAGSLTAVELAELQRVLAADAGAARLARQYERLHALLAAWRPVPANPDWAAIGDRLIAGVQQGRREAGLDQLLQQSLPALPAQMDWPAIRHRFSRAVHEQAGAAATSPAMPRAPRRFATLKIAVPLALAAAVTLLVWRPFGGPVAPSAKITVALGAPDSAGRVRIQFDETAAPVTIRPETAALQGPTVTAIVTHPPEGAPADSAEATVAALY